MASKSEERITMRCRSTIYKLAKLAFRCAPLYANLASLKIATDRGVMQQGLIFLGQGFYAVLNSGIFLCEYQSVPEIDGLKI